MPSEGVLDTPTVEVTPAAVRRGSGHLAVPGRASDSESGELDPRSEDELGGKPPWRGVYVGQHLSLLHGGKAPKGKPRSEPDSGNPTVRDRRGGPGKRGPWRK
jgi:hypothetical protein